MCVCVCVCVCVHLHMCERVSVSVTSLPTTFSFNSLQNLATLCCWSAIGPEDIPSIALGEATPIDPSPCEPSPRWAAQLTVLFKPLNASLIVEDEMSLSVLTSALAPLVSLLPSRSSTLAGALLLPPPEAFHSADMALALSGLWPGGSRQPQHLTLRTPEGARRASGDAIGGERACTAVAEAQARKVQVPTGSVSEVLALSQAARPVHCAWLR